MLKWRRDGNVWLLLHDRRRMGRVVPDSKYPGMYRSVIGRGRLSDMSNLTRAKDAALKAALREMIWDQRIAANYPSKCPVKRGLWRQNRRWFVQMNCPLPRA